MEATALTASTGTCEGSAFQQVLDSWRSVPRRSRVSAPSPLNPERGCSSSASSCPSTSRPRPDPGPVGHGFTQHNLDSGETWWSADRRRSCAPSASTPATRSRARRRGARRPVPVAARRAREGHGREEARAGAEPPQQPHAGERRGATGPGPGAPPRRGGRRPLLQHPVAIAWLNGHTHVNQILAHRRATAGFWEITTALVHRLPAAAAGGRDRRQPRRHAFAVHHRARPRVARGACLGEHHRPRLRAREFRGERLAENPSMRRGSPLDRNTELLLPAPFDPARSPMPPSRPSGWSRRPGSPGTRTGNAS